MAITGIKYFLTQAVAVGRCLALGKLKTALRTCAQNEKEKVELQCE
eukprot:COSAG04_NODE_661_length_11448_cov_24.495903_6_plen_46_part_00